MGSALVCVELGVGPKFEPNKFGGVGKKGVLKHKFEPNKFGGVGKKQSAFLLSLAVQRPALPLLPMVVAHRLLFSLKRFKRAPWTVAFLS